jgi:hypothetical protein
VLIEDKASGTQLIQDPDRGGLPWGLPLPAERRQDDALARADRGESWLTRMEARPSMVEKLLERVAAAA